MSVNVCLPLLAASRVKSISVARQLPRSQRAVEVLVGDVVERVLRGRNGDWPLALLRVWYLCPDLAERMYQKGERRREEILRATAAPDRRPRRRRRDPPRGRGGGGRAAVGHHLLLRLEGGPARADASAGRARGDRADRAAGARPRAAVALGAPTGPRRWRRRSPATSARSPPSTWPCSSSAWRPPAPRLLRGRAAALAGGAPAAGRDGLPRGGLRRARAGRAHRGGRAHRA